MFIKGNNVTDKGNNDSLGKGHTFKSNISKYIGELASKSKLEGLDLGMCKDEC